MAKIRVYELAKELGMSHKALLDKIMQLDIDVRSHMSSLEDDAVKIIREQVAGKKAGDDKNRPTVIRRRKAGAEAGDGHIEAGEEKLDTEKANEEVLEDVSASAETESFEPEVSEPEEILSANEADVAQEMADAPEASQPAAPEGKETLAPKKKETAAKIIFRPELLEAAAQKKEPLKKEAEAIKKQEKAQEKASAPDAAVKESVAEAQMKATPKATETAVKADTPEKPVAEEAETSSKDIQGVPSVEMDNSVKPEAEESGEEDRSSSKSKKKGKKSTAAKIIKLPEFTPEIPSKKPFKPEKRNFVDVPDIIEEEIIIPEVIVESDDEKNKKKFGGGGGDSWDKKGKKKSFGKKEVVEGNALYGEGKFGKKKKGGKAKPEPQKTQVTIPKAIKRRIKVDETIILAELAKRMGIKANEMIAKLMELGVMATVNQTIDYDTAVLVASEFGFEVEKASFEEETLIAQEEDSPESLITRAPVVTIMGHVDHGKTSLLDVIRKTKVANFEAGGITQHIGAYSVTTERGMITFLDTPGHEAFTSMRSRGAKITDIVILVVAADDGVMPQTVEAINHAKAAGVPIIVAVNKIDKPDADPDRVKRELSDHGVLAEDWGGDVIFVHVSAKQAINIDTLLEMILLQAEVLDLKANPEKMARGHVIEAKLDSGRGPVATVLIQEGTLKPGKYIVCGIQYGRVRAMINDKGQKSEEAGPSIPVEVLGLSGVPMAGDEIIECRSEKDARQISQDRAQKQRAKELAKNSRMSLEGLFEKLEEGEVKDLNLILKADVHGSIEALKESLSKLSTSEVKINVIHAATGTVTESDISLAAVSNAIILGFNVRPGTKVHEMADEENVDMRFYNIIYDAIKDIKNAMIGLMDSTYEERVMGRAEVVETFSIPKVGTIAGVMVSNGKIQKSLKARVLRNGIIVYDGNIASLRRFKDDVREVAQGYDCGIGIENFNDIKIGDTIECYYMEEIKPKMED